MKCVAREVEGGHLCIRDLDALGILSCVDLSAHFEACIGCGCSNQLDDCSKAPERLATPVDRDEREETMLDLVPFAGAGWQVADRNWQFDFVCKPLQFNFPEAYTVAVAAAAISGDHQAPRFWIAFASHRLPPSTDRIDRKGGGVMICPDADPSNIDAHVVDTVRHGAAQLAVHEIVNVDEFGRSFRPPFFPVVPGKELIMLGV
jgi:hypothetical protein